MEIWSRLVGGASPAKKPAANSPEHRLLRFKKVHDQLQLIWRRNNSSSKDISPPEPVFHCLQNIRQILQDESQTTASQLCARHVSTFHIYSIIAQLAAIYPDEGIIQETLDIFKILLDSEEGDFLKDKGFADALIAFISTVSASVLPIDLEARTVEVLFGIAAKLRLQPDLLSTWFRPSKKSWALPSETKQTHVDKEDFPLFYLTLDYVHHDGRAGDFARTGLLYLIELAAHSAALEQWIIESDLATLMASGLGALYSQLSRKLVLAYEEDEHLPPVASLSEENRFIGPSDTVTTTSPEFKSHLTTFLSYLVFWQDVLEHCSSSDVKQTLLEHFKFLFLQQLLYPSLIESSDRDGGSSVAVLTYLKCIIESIDHSDLVKLTFEYLLAIPEPKVEEKAPSRPTTLARRRRSQSLLASLAQGQEKPLPDLFNLDDLVLGSLRSNNQQTVNAALRLISTMLRMHHQFDVSLIKTGVPNLPLQLRSMESQEKNTAILFSIIESIMGDPTLGESYELHLEDAQTLLESHACTLQMLALPGTEGGQPGPGPTGNSIIASPTVASDDPVLCNLVALLEDFFANDVETNLSLTYTFATIASCARRRLDGWLLELCNRTIHTGDIQCPKNATADDDDDADETISIDGHPPSSEQTPQRHHNPPVLTTLDSLVKQVNAFRQEIESFDAYLTERRHVLKAGDPTERSHLQDTQVTRSSEDSGRTTDLPKKGLPQIVSISERLLSETSTANGSRSASPRGRRIDASSSTPTLVGRLSHLRQSPSRSPSKSASRAISPSPLRNDLRTDTVSEEQAVPESPIPPIDPLQQNIRIKLHRFSREKDVLDIRSETSSMRSDSVMNEPTGEQWKEVTLSQILTNVIILQEFALELVSIVQVRASLFGEVSLK